LTGFEAVAGAAGFGAVCVKALFPPMNKAAANRAAAAMVSQAALATAFALMVALLQKTIISKKPLLKNHYLGLKISDWGLFRSGQVYSSVNSQLAEP
jgi:Na+/citrate or Na+/malate symporter